MFNFRTQKRKEFIDFHFLNLETDGVFSSLFSFVTIFTEYNVAVLIFTIFGIRKLKNLKSKPIC